MHLQLDHNSTVPLHQQAEEWLRQLIRGEEYRNGRPIPPEVHLAQQLHISRSTLRQAISKLVFEGLLVRKRRQGTCVSESRPSQVSKPRVSTQAVQTNINPHPFEMHVCYAVPSKEALLFFGIDSHIKPVRLERLNGTMESPLEYTIAEFNPALPVSASDNFNRPLAELLEKEYRLHIKKVQETLHAAVADLFIATKLEIVPGSPLLVRKRYVYVADDFPAVFNTVYYKADAFTYTVEHLYP